MKALVKAWINDKIEFVAFWWHVLPAMVKHILGRWFVFRDLPQWVVCRIAGTELDGTEDDGLRTFIEEARRDIQSRLETMQHQLETLKRQIDA